jgi:predicted amidohydrolase YtcJ
LLDLVPPSSDADVRASFVANLKDFFRHGITSIVQAIDNTEHYGEWEHVYATHPKQLPRASVQLNFTSLPVMRAFNKITGAGDEWLRVGPIKVMVDGGFTGPAAYTTQPYKDQGDYRGKLNLTEEALADVINQAHDDGWQLGIHAIGDAAIELTVAQLVKTLERNPRADHRHYLNHFTVMPSAETMKLMAANGIAITQQPNFTYTLEGRYVANLDGQRLATNNPLRTPMDHGVHLALSSDILPIGPAVGLFAATTRQGASGAVYGIDERLTTLEALRGYTIKGAYLTREERLKGTLEVGKLADMVVLGSNPLEGQPADLLQLDIQQTYLGGRLVYNK